MIYVQDSDLAIHLGDAREVLPTLPSESVDCVATSPPFYGLRDYGTGTWEGGDPGCDHVQIIQRPSDKSTLEDHGVDGRSPSLDALPGIPFREICGKCGARRVDRQIGLEATPDEWVTELVAVFRECRRILRPSGTLWVECGDSYGANYRGSRAEYDSGGERQPQAWDGPARLGGPTNPYKPKDLIGAPWLLAFALRGPWYIGKIKKDIDRVWLAAMIDAEGCIYVHRRKAGTSSGARYTRTDGSSVEYARKQDTFGVMVNISNTSRAIVERCREIYGGLGSISSHEAGTGVQQRKQTLHQWAVTGTQARDLLREVYPHLVAKQHEARIAFSSPSSGDDALDYQNALKDLHNGRETRLDAKAPPGLWEPGFYFRQAIIWGKSNAMPESVRDRCTTAHSYIFLLTKQPRYYADMDAIAEPAAWERWGDQGTPTASGWIPARSKHELVALGGRTTNGQKPRTDERRGFDNRLERADGMKNARSVWSIPTRGYSGAHFATWPEALAERIILAGCPEWVCGTCGKPRERITEPSPEYEAKLAAARSHDGSPKHRTLLDENVKKSLDQRGHFGRDYQTVGWSDCGHGNYQQGTILDPFFGAGTTGLVARRLGRRCVGVELNEEYARMAAERCQQLSLFAEF